MTVPECPREHDVAVAAASEPWRLEPGADLGDHVASCAICREVVMVSAAFADGADARGVQVPSAAHMWWRLQMRARQDAVRAASRPLTVAQGIAAAAAMGLMAAVAGGGAMAGVWRPGVWTRVWQVFAELPALTVATPQAMMLAGIVAAGLLLVPVAVYFASSE